MRTIRTLRLVFHSIILCYMVILIGCSSSSTNDSPPPLTTSSSITTITSDTEVGEDNLLVVATYEANYASHISGIQSRDYTRAATQSTIQFRNPITGKLIETTQSFTTDESGEVIIPKATIPIDFFIIELQKEVDGGILLLQTYIGDKNEESTIGINEDSTAFTNYLKKIAFDSGSDFYNYVATTDIQSHTSNLSGINTYLRYIQSTVSDAIIKIKVPVNIFFEDYTDTSLKEQVFDGYETIDAILDTSHKNEIEDFTADFQTTALSLLSTFDFENGLTLPSIPDKYKDTYPFFLPPMRNYPTNTVFNSYTAIPHTISQLPNNAIFVEGFALPTDNIVFLGTGTHLTEGFILPDEYANRLPQNVNIDIGAIIPTNTILPAGTTFEDDYVFTMDQAFLYGANFTLPKNIIFEDGFELPSGADVTYAEGFTIPTHVTFPDDMIIPDEVHLIEGTIDETLASYFASDFQIRQAILDHFSDTLIIDDTLIDKFHTDTRFSQKHLDQMEHINENYTQHFSSSMTIPESLDEIVDGYNADVTPYMDYFITSAKKSKIQEINPTVAQRFDPDFMIDSSLTSKIESFNETIYEKLDDTVDMNAALASILFQSSSFAFTEETIHDFLNRIQSYIGDTIPIDTLFLTKISGTSLIDATDFMTILDHADTTTSFSQPSITLISKIDGELDASYWPIILDHVHESVKFNTSLLTTLSNNNVSLNSNHIALILRQLNSSTILNDYLLNSAENHIHSLELTTLAGIMLHKPDSYQYSQRFINQFGEKLSTYNQQVSMSLLENLFDNSEIDARYPSSIMQHIDKIRGPFTTEILDTLLTLSDETTTLNETFIDLFQDLGGTLTETFLERLPETIKLNATFLEAVTLDVTLLDENDELSEAFASYFDDTVIFSPPIDEEVTTPDIQTDPIESI